MTNKQISRYYVRLFSKENYYKEMLENGLFMNQACFFSKYDDECIGDITEGKVINKYDRATLTIGDNNQIVLNDVEMTLYNWYIYCLFELLEKEVKLENDNLVICSGKFQNFIDQYLKENEKVFIVLINAEKFDQAIKLYLEDKNHFYDSVLFSDFTPTERFMMYLKNGVKSILYNKKLEYAKYFSEKRLSVFHDGRIDYIRLGIDGIRESIINIYTKKVGDINESI